MPENFGTDFLTTPALSGVLVGGHELLVESLTRRLRTRRGALFYDPSYGSYLPEYLGEGFTDGGEEAAAICELDLEEDPRVLDAAVTVVEVTLRGVTLRADLNTVQGPLSLILDATAASSLYPAELEVTPVGIG